MATIGGTNLTLLDAAAAVDDGGRSLRIVEILAQVNQILGDMVVVEGNTQTGHKTALRTALPTPTWRKINQGVSITKATAESATFTAGTLEDLGQVDEELVALAANKEEFRFQQNRPHMEGISQQLASTLFTGNVATNPERFTGINTYYADGTTGANTSADNMVDGGGSGSDNTSLWLIVWGEGSIHGFYPKGTNAGIEHRDKGLQRVLDGSSNPYFAWEDQYKARLGLVVADYRQASRICNLDVSDLATAGEETDSSANLIIHAITAMNQIWNIENGRAGWYCNRTVKAALDKQAMNKANALVTFDNIKDGAPMTRLLGIPVRRVDAISNAESAVSF